MPVFQDEKERETMIDTYQNTFFDGDE